KPPGQGSDADAVAQRSGGATTPAIGRRTELLQPPGASDVPLADGQSPGQQIARSEKSHRPNDQKADGGRRIERNLRFAIYDLHLKKESGLLFSEQPALFC